MRAIPDAAQTPGGASTRGHSRLAAVGICIRMWWLRYVRAVRLKREPPWRILGSLIHLCLAYHWANVMVKNGRPPPGWFFEMTLGERLAQLGEGYPEEVRTAKDCYVAYAEWAPYLPHVPVEVEQETMLTLGEIGRGLSVLGDATEGDDAEPVTSRPDRVVESGGYLWVVDTKCLPAQTLIWTQSGPKMVGSLVGSSVMIATWNGTKLYLAPARIDVQPEEDVVRVRSSIGFEGLFGYRHPMLTRRGWVAAGRLQPTDSIAIPTRMPYLPEVTIPDALIAATGMLISDGALTKPDISYTKANPIIRGYYTGCLQELGLVRDETPPRVGREPSTYGDSWFREEQPARKGLRDRAHVVRVSIRSPILPMLDALGLARVKSPGRRIPEKLMSMSLRQTGILLGALFSGDGHAYRVTPKKGVARVWLRYSSRSEGLCRDVQSLLLRFGVVSILQRVQVIYKGHPRDYFHAYVCASSHRRFLDLIDQGAIRAPLIKHNMPTLREAIEAGGVGNMEEHALDENGVLWDGITSVFYESTVPVFNVEVMSPDHTFMADGMITHNSESNYGRDRLKAWRDLGPYALDWQVLRQTRDARVKYGVDRVRGLLIERIKRNPPFDFDIQPIEIPQLAYEDHVRTLRASVRRERELLAQVPQGDLDTILREGGMPEGSYWACTGRFGPCDSRPLCMARSREAQVSTLHDLYNIGAPGHPAHPGYKEEVEP